MRISHVMQRGVNKMSNQLPNDPYDQQVHATPYPPSEYVPATPYPTQQQGYAPTNPFVQQPVNAYGQQFIYPYGAPPQPEQGQGQALAGMILGIVGMIAWIFPLAGYPIVLTGLILSIIGRRSVSRKGMAIAGIILSSIALVLTLCSSAFGVYIATHR